MSNRPTPTFTTADHQAVLARFGRVLPFDPVPFDDDWVCGWCGAPRRMLAVLADAAGNRLAVAESDRYYIHPWSTDRGISPNNVAAPLLGDLLTHEPTCTTCATRRWTWSRMGDAEREVRFLRTVYPQWVAYLEARDPTAGPSDDFTPLGPDREGVLLHGRLAALEATVEDLAQRIQQGSARLGGQQ